MKLWLLSIIVFLAGCAGGGSVRVDPVPDSLPEVGTGIAKTQAHVESAERLTKQAVPHANVTGQALLGGVSAEHGKAIESLAEAEAALAASELERGKLEEQAQDLAEEVENRNREIAKVKGGWGYRLQQFVARLFWLLVALTVGHFVLGAVAPFVAGPAGAFLAKAGVLLNPFAWFQSARDNFFFRKKAPKDCPE